MRLSILAVIILITVTSNSHAQTKNFIDQPYIEVKGFADTLIVPDEIYIKIIISERDSKDRISVEEIESKFVASLKAIGIDTERDLSTNDLGSNYRFYFLKKRDVMKSKQYILKVTKATTASRVFMVLEDLDISNASIDRVDHSQIVHIKNLARSRAAANAKFRAEMLTRPLGQSVGTAIHIESDDIADEKSGLQGRVAGVLIRTTALKEVKGETPIIEFEKIKVSSAVNVKFVLK